MVDRVYMMYGLLMIDSSFAFTGVKFIGFFPENSCDCSYYIMVLKKFCVGIE